MRRLPLRSPPRMRGKEWYLQGESPAPGITPAYAGKSRFPVLLALSGWDHPRVCGEKLRAYAKIWNEWGLPPRMRGKDYFRTPEAMMGRITLAYAGKSIR